MATLWERLTGRAQVRQIADQLSVIQANQDAVVQNLAFQNNILQQQVLMQNIRSQGGFLRADFNNQINYIRDGYQLSSAVYSIVSDIAMKAANIPLKAYEVKDDQELKKYKSLIKAQRTPENLYKLHKLRTKALVEVEEDNPLQRLIDTPNTEVDAGVFWQMVTGFRVLTGNSYLYTPTLDMGSDKGKVTELHIMPAPYVLLYVSNTFPQRVLGYELIIDGVKLLDTKEVAHLRYPNYDYTVDGQQLYGTSPLKAAAKTLKRSNYSETAALSLLENGGPSVIIANKSIASDDLGTTQIGKAKEQFKREYSGPGNKGKYKMMAGDISAIPLGMSAVDMDLIAGEQWTFDMLCNIFHVSSVMFNNHDGNTESNVKEMRRDSYTRAIIPERQAHVDMLNRRIVPGYNTKGKKYIVDMDISGIPELQPDMVAMTGWLNTSYWVTPNEKREMQDFGKSMDPAMDQIWMANNLTTMDNAGISVDDIPSDENDFNGEEAEEKQ